jgi:serine/threonine protein kinase
MGINPGTIIERYEVRSLLGAGGMGEVYEAFDTRLERSVALKFLKQSDDAEKLRRFRQEAKAVSALNHPNILTIYEVGNYADYHFIVSELVVGKNLRDVITNEELTLDEILDIAVQIGNALAAAHHVGIVHRDIKPENIMILPDGYVKVLDFGLAKLIGLEKTFAPDSDLPTASLIETKAGMILGTVNYMSPEQLRGKAIDERTDIWSLGVVLFEMLTRRRPFTGESVSDVIAACVGTFAAPNLRTRPRHPA